MKSAMLMNWKRTVVLTGICILTMSLAGALFIRDPQRSQREKIKSYFRGHGARFGYGVPRAITGVPFVRRASGLFFDLGIVELQDLTASDTSVGNDDLVMLKGYRKLLSVELDNTGITDEGVAHLREVPELECLNVRNCKISDACIQDMVRMPKLDVLFIDGTQISESGVEILRASMPNCRIFYGWSFPSHGMATYVGLGQGVAGKTGNVNIVTSHKAWEAPASGSQTGHSGNK